MSSRAAAILCILFIIIFYSIFYTRPIYSNITQICYGLARKARVQSGSCQFLMSTTKVTSTRKYFVQKSKIFGTEHVDLTVLGNCEFCKI